MPASVPEVKKELILHFGAKITGSKFYEDYARIGSYLSDPGQYMPALRQLHIDMEGKLANNMDRWFRGGYDPRHRENLRQALIAVYETLEGGRPAPPPTALGSTLDSMAVQAFHKILTDALKDNELAHGFKVGSLGLKADLILGNAGRSFNAFLRDKRAFKDLGAGREHGESSHRIQWYLISKMMNLDHPVDEIYSKLPGWKTAEKGYRYFYMWEFLVDRDGVPTNATVIPFKTGDQSDFRAPSNVNRWLKDGRTPRLELLAACLTNRFNRRAGWAADEYLAKKQGRDFSKLDAREKEELFEFLTSSDAVVPR